AAPVAGVAGRAEPFHLAAAARLGHRLVEVGVVEAVIAVVAWSMIAELVDLHDVDVVDVHAPEARVERFEEARLRRVKPRVPFRGEDDLVAKRRALAHRAADDVLAGAAAIAGRRID